MRDMLSLGIKLLVITLIAGALLGLTNALTAEPIRAQEAAKGDLARAALFPGAAFEPAALEEGAPIDAAWYALVDGARAGVVIETTARGFAGGVALTVGIDGRTQTLTGIRVGAHSETPGLGDKAAKEPFYGQFAGKPLGVLSVVKSAPADMDIQAISAATVTSRGVTDAVNAAMAYAQEKLLGE